MKLQIFWYTQLFAGCIFNTPAWLYNIVQIKQTDEGPEMVDNWEEEMIREVKLYSYFVKNKLINIKFQSNIIHTGSDVKNFDNQN